MGDGPSVEDAARRRAAGAFLRSRRERLLPATVGLPVGARRRTPGLRREEVAMLANVGTTWYTWLEQGRDVRPSDDVLRSLAEALRLDPVERRQLFLLGGRTPPAAPRPSVERIGAPLRRMLDGLDGQPALVLNRRWDLLAWNRAANLVFGPYDRLEGDALNALHLLFADPAHRRLLVDWEAIARATLAMFRADSVRDTGDPAFARLVDRLARASPDFARWWARHDVTAPLAGLKRIDHPRAGRLAFEYASLALNDPPDARLILFTPASDGNAADALRALLRADPVPIA